VRYTGFWSFYGKVAGFSCRTVFYCIQHKNTKEEFALMDCWVDIDSLNHKVEFLQAVDSVPNMVQLVKYWDAEYAGCVNNTLKICNHVHDHLPDSPIFTNKNY
jgi:hypothetical protein